MKFSSIFFAGLATAAPTLLNEQVSEKVLAPSVESAANIQTSIQKIQSGQAPCFDLFECMVMGYGFSASCDRSGNNAMFLGLMGTCTDGTTPPKPA